MFLSSGGRLLGDYQTPVEESDFGYLQSATHRVIARKSYVHLEAAPSGGTVCTLMLCARTEEAVQELKVGIHWHVIIFWKLDTPPTPS